MSASKQKLINQFSEWHVFDVAENRQYVLLRDFTERQGVPALVIVAPHGAYVTSHPTKHRWISKTEFFAMLEQDFEEFRDARSWVPLFTVSDEDTVLAGDSGVRDSFAEATLAKIEEVLLTFKSMSRTAKVK